MQWIRLVCIIAGVLGSMHTASAQRAKYKPQVHEIGIQLGQSYQITSQSTYLISALPFEALPVNGLRYKYHLTLSDGLRFAAFYQRHEFSSGELTNISELFSEASYRGVSLQAGYEYKYHNGPHQGFVGADLVGNQGEMVNLSTAVNPITNSIQTRKFGLAAFAGYSFFLGTHLSLTLEAQAQYLRVSQHNPWNLNAAEFAPYVLPDQEWGLSIAAYISFHTQKMKKRCACPKH